MLTISDIATKYLDEWHDDFMRGQLQIWELPLPIQAFYWLGEIHARKELQAEIQALRAEVSRLWIQLKNPKEKQDFLINLMNDAMRANDNPDWAAWFIESIATFHDEVQAIPAALNSIKLDETPAVDEELPNDRHKAITGYARSFSNVSQIHDSTNVA